MGLTSQHGQKMADFVGEFQMRNIENAKFGFVIWMMSLFEFIDSVIISDFFF